jgi:hypothetical protein
MSRERLPVPLTLDTLADRIVPATIVDLTTPGASLPAGEAIVTQCDAQPTGTGFIQSFVRVQGAAKGGGSQHGYNTTARPLQFDENSSPSFTRSLKVGDVPRRTVDGVNYREFLLDINQKSSASFLSLDEVRLFLAGTPDLTGYDVGAKTLAGNEAVFDMDATEDVTVKLNARLNHGSGSGDMFLLVPESAFARPGVTADTFVYLYSKMGGLAGASANSGFEEWAVKTDGGGAPVVPEAPVQLSSLSGRVYLDTDQSWSLGEADTGLAGVTIQLQGVDDVGRTVVLTTTTDANGNYTFTGLRPGTYTLLEYQPLGYRSAANDIGSEGGAFDPNDMDRMIDIVLAAGIHGWGYNFGEQLDSE